METSERESMLSCFSCSGLGKSFNFLGTWNVFWDLARTIAPRGVCDIPRDAE